MSAEFILHVDEILVHFGRDMDIVWKRQALIPTNANNCRLHSITSGRIGNPELKAAMKYVHEYNNEILRKMA